ncbi:Uncharacterized conserved protein [Jannaschia faecimaris]|uniref:Uncharacterized conserved protein n=1 Tax=Jannaschia faecimaris TaxID=1244108 RepID=A0A1H3S9N7_9RHOB|nr:DUF411 domain-containing protein [Jannaschia faecimaris]SDZ34624.1 Uncharacterized conserved protein [Jannaschia faecimaris]
MNRRAFIVASLSAPLFAHPALAAAPRMSVAKSPTCGCCSAWVDHVRAAGFSVDVTEQSQEALWMLKNSLSIAPDLSSCHTARIDGYFVEGHVPAADISRLLAEKPDALGLTVPGMPVGSPGMEMGARRDPFETLLILRDGSVQVFTRHT